MDSDCLRSVPVEDPYAEIASMAADVFRTVAISLLVISIARPLLKLAGFFLTSVLISVLVIWLVQVLRQLTAS